MKSMLDSPEAFEAYATIDYCYWRLREISKLMKGRKLSPIEMTVDKACGYDHYTEYYPEIIDLLETIIESKTFIEADSTEDKKILEQQVRTLRGQKLDSDKLHQLAELIRKA